ncbi:MAG: gamma-glutamyltransferase [Verrucomicrobiota bacterium]
MFELHHRSRTSVQTGGQTVCLDTTSAAPKNKATCPNWKTDLPAKAFNLSFRKGPLVLLSATAAALGWAHMIARADYVGSVSTVSANSSVHLAATEILGAGGGSGVFSYKGGGNAVDAAVAAALAACVVNPGNASLGGYGGHMMIYKSGWDGEPQWVTCIDFNSAAGSLASSNMFASSVDPTTGKWIAGGQPANQYGWKAAGVPGTFAGLFMAQTNYGRKMDGTNYFPFAEILKPALARIANGQAAGTAYYTLTSVSNLLMDLYTNSPGYLNNNGTPNPHSSNDPHAVFYSGGIALDIAAAMQANGGLVTYADMTNYRPREVTPYRRHFDPPNGTPAWVCVAPPGSAGLSVLEEIAMIEALGWTNGPDGTWDSLHYWHSRAEVSRLMWKDHFQWLGDPWSGVLPPDILGNGSTNFCDQLLAHATNGYQPGCPWDTNEIPLTNSLAGAIIEAVNNQTNVPILVQWDDIRYGTRNISTSDQWGNCVALTFSMGGGFGAQVAVTNRALVLGQGMALFDARPGWPDSIAPGKRPVNNMCPAIVIPDYPVSPTNGLIGGRPPFAVGGVGGSTIENNMAMQLVKYLMDAPSSAVTAPAVWLYNYEGNKSIHMRPSYPAGVQSYLGTVGLSAPGGPPSSGELSSVQAWVAPVILTPPVSRDVGGGSTVIFEVTATGLPLFYQWFKNGVPLTDGGAISGAQTPQLTVSSVTSGAAYAVTVFNGGASASGSADLTINGAPAIVTQPVSRANLAGTLATFSVSAIGAAPLAYQWTKNGLPLANGGNVSGATSPTLNLANVSTADATTYAVIITNFSSSVTSALATLTIAPTNPPGQFLYEPFDYANIGGPVSSNTPLNWTSNGTGANDLNVSSGSLFWPGLATSIGNSVTNGGTGLGVRRLFGTNISSGKIYFSALFRINDLGFGSWNGLASQVGALTATDNTSFRLQVMIRSNSPGGYVFGAQKGGSGATTTFDTTERHAVDTIFLVGKYDFTVAPNTGTLWINPGSATFGTPSEPATGFISTTNGPDGFTIDRFNMRQNAASGSSSVPAALQWDELRFGRSWADVTPIGPPGMVKLTEFTKLPDGTFQFAYSNSDGQTYSVFASTNLVDWQSIGAATQTSPGWFQFTDPNTGNVPYRFYQLRSP